MANAEVQQGVVGAAAVPHAPQFFTLPETEDHEQVARIEQSMRDIGGRLLDLEPDAVVVMANDHLENFLLHCVPAFTIHRGPRASGSFADRDFSWVGASSLATDLLVGLQDQGFDPAASLSAPIGYEFGIPLTFMGIPSETPIIPLYVNSYVPPQPSPDRCYAFGQALARVVAALGKRVVIVASGGLSHYPGTALYSSPDADTDTALLAEIKSGNLRALLNLDAAALDRTGNVEARSWLILAGALGERVPDVVALEPSWHHNYAMVGWYGESSSVSDEPLHYPIPDPAQLDLYEALYDLRMNHTRCRQFINDPAAVADLHNISGPGRDAFIALDEDALNALGLHPLIVFLARLNVKLVGQAEDTEGSTKA